MKKTTRSIMILLSMIIIMQITPFSIHAAQPAVNYMSSTGSTLTCNNYTLVRENTFVTDPGDDSAIMGAGWYVVDQDVAFSRNLKITGNVNLILCDGATMNANKGILVRAEDHAALTIWGQRMDAGKLIATGDSAKHSAGIGRDEVGDNYYKDVGLITINGGEITATGGSHATGIGAGLYGRGGTVIIAGGIVTAKGGSGSIPAIGANLANKGDLTIYDLASVTAGLNETGAVLQKITNDNDTWREHGCLYNNYAKIEPCTHSHKEYEITETGHRMAKCLYCKLPAETAWTPHTMVSGQCTVCGYREKIVPDNSEQSGKSGKSSQSRAAAEAAIKNAASDEGPSGSVFHLLQARQKKVTKHSITITWNKIPDASYIIFGNRCGRKNPYLKVAETGKTKLTFKKLKKGKYYKFIVLAVKNNQVVSVSKTLHIATAGGKYGNHTKVTISKKKLTLKKGKTRKLKAKTYFGKLKVKVHRGVKWESSNPKVATVKKGKIKAVGKGTAKIYAYAQNGKFAKCTVKVK